MGDSARRLLAAVFAVALVFTALPGTNWTAPIDPGLVAGDYALVQVAHGSASAVAAKASAAGASDVAALDTIDVVTARVSASAIDALRNDSRVAFLAADAIVTAAGKKPHFEKEGVEPASAGNAAIEADKAWAESTGRGVTVALMDTGIATHPDLTGSVVARVDFVGDGVTGDPAGHGTFVAGLIAAHGKEFKGVAPDAKLVSLRVLDERGDGSMHSVLAAFDWLLRNRVAYHIGVLNLSFGAPQKSSYHQELLAGVVESAWFAGVTVVAAAGNDGPGPSSVSLPGGDPFVITVGSLYDRGTPPVGDDRESVFSGRGPTLDGFTKPDLLAPGEHVVSLRLPDTSLDRGTHAKSDRGDYGQLSGTSASSAMVAGVAALVLEEHRNYSPTQVKGALVAGSRKITGSRTPGVDAKDSLEVHPASVNAKVAPSKLLLAVLKKSGQLDSTVDWAGVSWEGVSWESVTWEGITWESVSWESVTWEGVGWEAKS